jgi:hypothetical protein
MTAATLRVQALTLAVQELDKQERLRHPRGATDRRVSP